MLSLKSVIVACALALTAFPLMADTVDPPRPPRARVSPHETINALVEGTYQNNPRRVVIVYGRPYTKAPNSTDMRKIWGGLVPWDKVWRTGADEATLLITESTLQFGDTTVSPGAYSLYTLPSENGTSKLIINKQIGQWGLTYDEKQDLARIDLKKDTLSAPVDQFTMAIQPKQGGGGGTIKMLWETTQYSIEFTTKK
jgi:hypothetical protein